MIAKLLSGAPRVGALGLVCTAAVACGGAAPPPTAPAATGSPHPRTVPAVFEENPPAPVVDPLPALPASVPPAPALCAEFVDRPTAPAASCEARAALGALDAAFRADDRSLRDEVLASLEPCEVFPGGWVRALRAELGPAECADAMAAPVLLLEATERAKQEAERQQQIPGDIEQVLVGLAIASRLQRLTEPVPEPPADADRTAFEAYFESALKPWVLTRTQIVHELSLQGSALRGYARAVVAVEAAVADLAFVQTARDVPLPSEMAADPRVREAYYAALDEALEPRKRRGRDAALVGLSDLAELGVINSARLERARSILAASYAGARITALDRLVLPPMGAADASTVELRLLAALPTFFAQHLLASVDVTKPAQLRAMLSQGVYPSARAQLDSAPLSAASAGLYARALVSLGQRYYRSAEFSRAAAVVGVVLAPGQKAPPENQLLAALASALKEGPKDAAHMMLGGPLLPPGFGNVEALDVLSREPSSVAHLAAYNAATILAFLPPQTHVKQFWKGIAQRYEFAAAHSTDPAFTADAKRRARSAKQTARAVR